MSIDANCRLKQACIDGDEIELLEAINCGANAWNLGLKHACLHGHEHIVDMLLAYGADDYNVGLGHSAMNGNKRLVLKMIKLGADRFNNAINYAASKIDGNNEEIIELLLNKGAGVPALLNGAGEAHNITLISQYNSNTEIDTYNILLGACSGGHLDLIIDTISKVNLLSILDKLIYSACYNGHLHVCTYLLNYGSCNWNNALKISCRNQQTTIFLQFLLDKGTSNLDEALKEAVNYCHKTTILFLIEHGAKICAGLSGVDIEYLMKRKRVTNFSGYEQVVNVHKRRHARSRDCLTEIFMSDIIAIVCEY